MNDTAIIITAIAGLITACGVPIGAASKLAPVLAAMNKMLADQHKRAKEAKNDAERKHTSATSTSIGDNLSRLVAETKSSPIPAWGFWATLIFLLITLLLPLLSSGPATSTTIAACAISAAGLVVAVMSYLGILAFQITMSAINSLLGSHVAILSWISDDRSTQS